MRQISILATHRVTLHLPIAIACAVFGVACSGDESSGSRLPDGYGDYSKEQVTAIGTYDRDAVDGDAPPVQVGTQGADGEVCFSVGPCTTSATGESEWCEREGGPVDVIYVDGKVVETICYPPADDPERPVVTIDTAVEGDVDIAQTANQTTVVFSDDTDGMPFVGDLSVDGNNVAIYGNGADNTVIDGEVTLDGNNIRLRGVTITGDLIISKNNIAVVLCKILGNVVLDGQSTNGSVFANNDIFGSFTSNSNGNVLVGNSVRDAWSVTGNGATCDNNHAFIDNDGNEVVAPAERGAELTCP